jgi:hypothetical protein
MSEVEIAPFSRALIRLFELADPNSSEIHFSNGVSYFSGFEASPYRRILRIDRFLGKFGERAQIPAVAKKEHITVEWSVRGYEQGNVLWSRIGGEDGVGEIDGNTLGAIKRAKSFLEEFKGATDSPAQTG